MKIIGLMSGTSVDGVDAALLEFDEAGVRARIASHFEPYEREERRLILENLGKWEASPEALDAIHAGHNRALAALPEADYVGFHGQTLNHDPQNGRSFQAGHAEALLTKAQIVFDFRAQDLAAGGEGAPLIPIYHYALAKALGFSEAVEFVNIGGVANVSFVDPALPPEKGLIAFDAGVGNAISDDLMQHFYGERFDQNGARAQKGCVDQSWLEKALDHPFFSEAAPKSLDRFSLYRDFEDLKKMRAEDALASAMALTAAGIERARMHYPKTPHMRILVGGGRHNEYLRDKLGGQVIEEFGLDGDMIEAEGFAYLAWAYLQGMPVSFPQTTGVLAPVWAGRMQDAGR